MKRRAILSVVVACVMVVLVAISAQKPKANKLLLLEWATNGKHPTPPIALLIEMGVKDTEPKDWSAKATVAGAKVVHREGYRFRKDDTLTEPNGWKAASRRGVAVPKGNPLVARQEGIATIGVVLHLSEIGDDAKVTVDPPSDSTDKAAVVALKDVLSGKPQPVWEGKAIVRLISTATPIAKGKTEDDFPAACYAPDGTLWVAWIAYALKDEGRRIEAKPLDEQPTDFKKYHHPGFGDQLFVRYYRSGKWSHPVAVTGAKEDLVRCALAAEKNGDVWAVYSANRKGNYDLYARKLDLNTPKAVSHPEPNLGAEQRLTDNPNPDLGPVACTGQSGQVLVGYQCWTFPGEDADIGFTSCAFGKWEKGISDAKGDSVLSTGVAGSNSWNPVLASGGRGEISYASDVYYGDYDIRVAGIEGAPSTQLSSSRFEARPSLCYDNEGHLWIAYEDGPELWGKDYGAFDSKDGQPLYSSRSVRVVCLDNRRMRKPIAELPTFNVPTPQLPYGDMGPKFERATRQSAPKIGLDGKGRIWIVYRQKFGSRYSSHAGSYWLSFARRLDGDKWSEPIELHHADGMLDHRPVLLPHSSGGLLIVHTGDGRYTTPEDIHHHVYTSYVDLPGDPVEPKLEEYKPEKKDPKLVAHAKKEAEAVRAIREHRVLVDGKKCRLLRGEYHRHTEISWDGGPDGSLEDMFRYALDAASMDWIGNGDHDNGGGREYSWWLTQKMTDAYLTPTFTPMFTYERSVRYPHGHRNVMFAQRGVMTLPRLSQMNADTQVAGIHADDTKMLYRYLREHDGICAVHTSATSMGTDWRDNDAVVEPIVEIYQGDRMSYEHQNAPRAGYDPKSNKEPANIAGWFPDGFIDKALDKGYKLGFQASSDHWSTHISFFVVLSEKNDRASILSAIKKRHCYGATDNIIVDFRSGDHVMGDEFSTRGAPAFQFHVIGTDALAEIDILRDSKPVHTIKPEKREFKGEWRDPKPEKGKHYYHLRVRQKDGEIAWASPMWVTME